MTFFNKIRDALKKLADPGRAKILARFFKTGKGQYGYGDIFLGVMVPQTRQVARRYKDASLSDISQLLKSKIHEERLAALLILNEQYAMAREEVKKTIFDFYLANTNRINNWDLVDLTAHRIIGDYLSDKEKSLLTKLAKSDNVWERRIAIIATYDFIKKERYEETFRIAKLLIKDKHDLIHKAVGWMLREVGKRDERQEEIFLGKYYKLMPRTTLRYAIERFSHGKRRFYLGKTV